MSAIAGILIFYIANSAIISENQKIFRIEVRRDQIVYKRKQLELEKEN